jgi:hypothetical protein
MMTGSSAGAPWLASRAKAVAKSASLCWKAQWSITMPRSSMTVTSWLALAQSHPTNINPSPSAGVGG